MVNAREDIVKEIPARSIRFSLLEKDLIVTRILVAA
jgi:hypothetical protein